MRIINNDGIYLFIIIFKLFIYHRDLSVILNAKNIGSGKSGNSSVVQWQEIGDPKNSLMITTPKYTAQAISDLSKKKNVNVLQHFCECGVDCSKGLFEK